MGSSYTPAPSTGGGSGPTVYQATQSTGNLASGGGSVDLDFPVGFTSGIITSATFTLTAGTGTMVSCGQFKDALRTDAVNYIAGTAFSGSNVPGSVLRGPVVSAGGNVYAAPMVYLSDDNTCRLTVVNRDFGADSTYDVTVTVMEVAP